MKFNTVKVEKVSGVRCTYSLRMPTFRFEPYSRIVAVHCKGTYRYGSGGAPDARVIVGLTKAAITIWDADALILDLRKLRYDWGDEMDMVLSAPTDQGDIAFAVVVGERCAKAIGTLIFGERSVRPATDSEGIFDDFERAVDWVESNLASKREALERKFASPSDVAEEKAAQPGATDNPDDAQRI